jgi:hypothetical protein
MLFFSKELLILKSITSCFMFFSKTLTTMNHCVIMSAHNIKHWEFLDFGTN